MTQLGRKRIGPVAELEVCERVIRVSVRAELHDEDLRVVLPDAAKPGIERCKERPVAGASREREIDGVPCALAPSALVRRARSWKETAVVFVERDDEHVLFPEDRLRAVAVMSVDVEDRDTADAVVPQIPHRDGDVIEKAEPRGAVRMRVVETAGRIENVHGAVAGDEPAREDRTADGERGTLEHSAVRGGLSAVDQTVATAVQLAEEAEICAGVDRRELVDARFGSQEQSKTGGEESRISERGDGTGVPGPRRPSGNEAATSEAIVPHETDAAAHRLAG